jgi:hypothetical protein
MVEGLGSRPDDRSTAVKRGAATEGGSWTTSLLTVVHETDQERDDRVQGSTE